MQVFGSNTQLEFENVPNTIVSLPGIYQFKYTVIDPNTILDFLIDAHKFRKLLAALRTHSSFVKQSVLGKLATRR
jgi:hypothetical protein